MSKLAKRSVGLALNLMITSMAPLPGDTIDRDAVLLQTQRITASRHFHRCTRLARFLAFTVSETLAGRSIHLKEYTIAVEVFDKPSNFDARLDSAVRVSARALRLKLEGYYITDGRDDEIVIELSPGDYVPRFRMRNEGQSLDTAPADSLPAVVVEPDTSSARIVSDCLREWKYPITCVVDSASRGREALRSPGDHLLIAATRLRDGDGFDLARARQNPTGPVIFLAAPTLDTRDVEGIVNSGPVTVVYKPIRSADLMAALKVASRQWSCRSSGLPSATSDRNVHSDITQHPII